jgi:hypothetical protein
MDIINGWLRFCRAAPTRTPSSGEFSPTTLDRRHTPDIHRMCIVYAMGINDRGHDRAVALADKWSFELRRLISLHGMTPGPAGTRRIPFWEQPTPSLAD